MPIPMPMPVIFPIRPYAHAHAHAHVHVSYPGKHKSWKLVLSLFVHAMIEMQFFKSPVRPRLFPVISCGGRWLND